MMAMFRDTAPEFGVSARGRGQVFKDEEIRVILDSPYLAHDGPKVLKA